MKAHQPMDTGYAFAIDTAVAHTACNLYLGESSFSQHPLHEPLEGGGGQFLRKDAMETLPPVQLLWCVRCLRSIGNLRRTPLGGFHRLHDFLGI